MATLCFFFKAEAQTITPLKIGDTIPEALWNMPLQVVSHPKEKQVTTLKDYKSKLIILDFWATWCAPCIENFPVMEDLQQKFSKDIQILTITSEKSEKVIKFLKSSSGKGLASNLPMIVEDNLLKRLFEHRLIPHYVWITPNGEIAAITSANGTTVENVKQILKGGKSLINSKIDINEKKPLFAADNLPIDSLIHYSILYKGYLESTGSSLIMRNKNGITNGLLFTNHPLIMMFEYCFRNLDKTYSPNRLIAKLSDSTKLFIPALSTAATTWYPSNAYAYDLIIPQREKDHLYDYMLKDLNHYSPFIGSIELKKQKCMVLSRTNRHQVFISTGGKAQDQLTEYTLNLNNLPMNYLLNYLNNQLNTGLPVVDETGYTGKVTIKLQDVTDLNALKSELRRQGLKLTEEWRTINEFKIIEKN